MTKEEKYINNAFSVALLFCTQKATESMMKKSGFKIGQNNFHLLNSSEKYVSSISKINGDLRRVFEQINSIKIFIKRFTYKHNDVESLEKNLERATKMESENWIIFNIIQNHYFIRSILF